MAASSIATEISARKFFPSQFRITAEQRLLDFCTNTVGTLLFDQQNAGGSELLLPQQKSAAIIGNPLRLLSLDPFNGTSTGNKLLNWSGSTTTLEPNCTGRYLAMAAGPSLSIFDLQKGAILRELHDHDGPIGGITWHRTSPWLLASVGADCTLRLWDLRLHPAQFALRRTTRPYRRLEYSPDCNYIACAGQLVSIFDLNMAQSVVHMACSSPANNVCFNPTECLLATSSDDRVVRFWDVDTGECVTKSPAFDSAVNQMCFAPDGHFLVVNTAKQISCIRWEPFELLSQLPYPIPMQSRAASPPITPPPPPPSQCPSGPQISLLDVRIQGGRLHQLAVISADPSKMGTACVASIPLEQLEKCGIDNTSDFLLDNSGIPACPTAHNFSKEEEEVFEEEKSAEEHEEQREEDDISPESVSTSATADSMLDSLTTLQQPHQPMGNAGPFFGNLKKTPLTAPQNRKRPPRGATIIKRGASSVELGVIGIATPNNSSAIEGGLATKIRQKRQQREAGGATLSEFSSSGGRRPNRLPILQQQPSTSNNNNGSGSADSSDNRKSLIRRGSSLNDVTDITVENNTNNMPISSIALANAKNRSRSQAQPNRQSKFSSSTGSSSSNASTNSTTSSSMSGIGFGIGGARHRRTTMHNIGPAHPEEDLEEFMQFDPKIRASITKQTNDAKTLLASIATVRGNITEQIVEQAARFEEPHLFAQLLDDYMRKPKSYSMGLNAAFLGRVHAIIGHRNDNYVQLTLDFLDMVTTRFGDSIRHGLASQEYTIGVDVAAEQRFERCNKCKNALFQIRLNSAFNTERMDSEARQRFEKEIVPRIDNIIAKTIKQSPSSDRANQSSVN